MTAPMRSMVALWGELLHSATVDRPNRCGPRLVLTSHGVRRVDEATLHPYAELTRLAHMPRLGMVAPHPARAIEALEGFHVLELVFTDGRERRVVFSANATVMQLCTTRAGVPWSAAVPMGPGDEYLAMQWLGGHIPLERALRLG